MIGILLLSGWNSDVNSSNLGFEDYIPLHLGLKSSNRAMDEHTNSILSCGIPPPATYTHPNAVHDYTRKRCLHNITGSGVVVYDNADVSIC